MRHTKKRKETRSKASLNQVDTSSLQAFDFNRPAISAPPFEQKHEPAHTTLFEQKNSSPSTFLCRTWKPLWSRSRAHKISFGPPIWSIEDGTRKRLPPIVCVSVFRVYYIFVLCGFDSVLGWCKQRSYRELWRNYGDLPNHEPSQYTSSYIFVAVWNIWL